MGGWNGRNRRGRGGRGSRGQKSTIWGLGPNISYSMEDILGTFGVRSVKAVAKVLQVILSAASHEAMTGSSNGFSSCQLPC